MCKDEQTFCLGLFISLLHKVRSCSTLYLLCCCYLSRMKTNGSCISNIANCNVHLDFRGMQVFVWFYRKNVVVITCWCNFRQQRSVDSILVNFSFIFSNSQNKISILFLFYFCKIHIGFVVNQLIKKSGLNVK